MLSRDSVRLAWVLLKKEARELCASRAFVLLLLVSGPLAGQAANRALHVYLEASGTSDAAAALPEVLQPLSAFLTPVFGSFALLSALLFPFVAIRLITPERLSGGLELLVQTRASLSLQIGVKALALLAAGCLAALAPVSLTVLYVLQGGPVSYTEAANLLIGHLVHFSVCCGIGLAAGALARDSSSAALAALAATLGTWALDFWSQGRSGLAADAASLTPAHLLSAFEKGELPLAGMLATLLVLLSLGGLVRVFLEPGKILRQRAVAASMAALPALVAVVLPALFQLAGWPARLDQTEGKRLSFSSEERAILRAMGSRLSLTINLAPEDPRLFDLEQEFLAKFRRAAPAARITYQAASQTGLFEAASEQYGTIVFELDGKKRATRSTIEAVLLGEVLTLASVSPPPSRGPGPAGHRLERIPKGISLMAFGVWPVAVILAVAFIRRPRRS